MVYPRLVFNSFFSSLQRAVSFLVANLFAATNNSLLRGEPEASVFLDLSFVVVKHSFAVANLFVATSNVDQQLPLHLISSITLLDLPSNLAKFKQMGD